MNSRLVRQVLALDGIKVDDEKGRIEISFAPTGEQGEPSDPHIHKCYVGFAVPGCNMAPLIGLSLRVKLMHSLPRRFKVHSLQLLFVECDRA